MSDSYVHVRIIGSHPHTGATGRIKFVDDETETKSILGGPPMFLVELDDDGTGVGSCYAEKKNLLTIPVPRTV